MSNHFKIRSAVLFLGGLFLCGLLAPGITRAGEIASLLDEHGHRIFVNDADLPPVASPVKPKFLTSTYAYHPLPYMHRATPSAEISKIVAKSAGQHRVDPNLVHAIIQVESAYNPRAVSRKGARGLMQLIPSTATRFGVRNSFNPKQNIEGGVTYLRYLLDLFGGNVPLCVAAYNAGENAVLRKGGIPAYNETVNYVQRVTSLYNPEAASAALVQSITEPEQTAPIYRLVDAHGSVHYTNGDSL